MDILLSIVILVLNVYMWMIIACIILSWLPELQKNKIAEVLSRMVDPVLAPFRKIIPPLGNLDFTAAIVAGLIYFAVVGLSRFQTSTGCVLCNLFGFVIGGAS